MVEQSYRDFLGLTRNPFAEPRKGFFNGSNRQQLLDQLQHLSQWSTRVLLVTGVRGSGKTSLYRALADSLESRAIAVRIQGALTSEVREVLVAIAHALGLDHPMGANVPLLRDLIQRHISELADSDNFVVLMVDDAHLLEPKAREQLLALQSAAKARLVLFGEPRFVGAVIELARRSNLQWHEAKLRSFNAQEVRAYIEWRLGQVEGEGIRPFTEQDIAEISRHSEGRPAVIDVLGEDMLNGKAMGDPPAKSRLIPMPHRLLAGLLVLLVGMAYLVVKRLEQSAPLDLADQTINQNVESKAALPREVRKPSSIKTKGGLGEVDVAEKIAAATTDSSTARVSPNSIPALPSNQSRSLEGPKVAERLVQPDNRQANSQKTGVEVKPPPPAAPVAKTASITEVSSVPKPVPAAKPVPVAKPAVMDESARSTTRPTGLAGTRSARWLLQQAPEAYVIQLLTLSSEERLEDFLLRQQEPQQFATYRLQRDGRTYHVVVYGFYKDRASAERASRNLPGTVGQLKPWIRTLGPIQNAIRGALQR